MRGGGRRLSYPTAPGPKLYSSTHHETRAFPSDTMVGCLLPVSGQEWRLLPIIVRDGERIFGRDQSTSVERIGIADLSLSRRLGRLRELAVHGGAT